MNKEIIICSEDNEFQHVRKIAHSCNRTFMLDETNVFYVETLGYFDETIGQYYTICPHCGYLVLLEEKKLSNELKISAEDSYRDDPYQYHKNSLKSQLIYLNSITPKGRTKKKARVV